MGKSIYKFDKNYIKKTAITIMTKDIYIYIYIFKVDVEYPKQ